jgi:hypothetical protein
MKRALESPLRTAVSTAFVARAAVRVLWHEGRTDLPELVARLRATPPPRLDFDVKLADGIVERLLPLLPPWGAGRCVKRALIQLDLWSRAGRAPRLHVGLFETGASRAGHVWVTTDGAVPEGIRETWST